MKTLTSCLRGRQHVLRREPCEDRFAVLPLPGGLAAAAADGHGAARCCRAGFGARVACASALHALSDPALSPEALAGAIRQRYERLCRRHLARHPLTEREQALLAGLAPLYAYGTTLVCARTDAAGTTLLRIGDSEVLALGSDGLPFPILAADPNCTGSATTSLADPDAETAARVARYDRPAAALLLFTDGYSYRGQLPAGLLDLLRAPLPDAIPAELLDRGDHGDDQTVLLAADEALCAGEGFRRGLTELLDRLAAAEALRKLQRERREVMAYLRLAQKALRERQGEDLRSLCCHTREQLDRLQALDAEIAALSAAS